MPAPERVLVTVGGAALAGGLAATLAIEIDNLSSPLVLLAVGVVTLLQVAALRLTTGNGAPVAAIVIVALNVVGAAGYLFYRDIANVAQASATLPAGRAEYAAAASAFALASLATLVGGIVGGLGRHRFARKPRPPASAADPMREIMRLPRSILLLASTIPLILSIVAVGPAEVISRAYYLTAAGPTWLVSLSTLLSPVGIAGAAVVLFDKRKPSRKAWAALILAGYVAVLFSGATRWLGFVPIILLGAYMAQVGVDLQRRRVLVAAGVALAVSIFFLQLPLALRSRVDGAGLGPYVAALASHPDLALSTSATGVVGNVLFAVPLTGFIAADVKTLPADALGVSVTPLPSGLTRWSELAPVLRVNYYTPFNTLGELAAHGYLVLIAYFVFAGFLASRLQDVARRLTGHSGVVTQIAVAGLLLLFSAMVLQYNLRSSARLLWYASLAYVALRLFSAMRHTDQPDSVRPNHVM